MPLDPAVVRSVQTRLRGLGFRLFTQDDEGKENEWFSSAIKEFQTYARMPKVAAAKGNAGARWVDNLVVVDNAKPYSGPINGLYDLTLEEYLGYWEGQTTQYRCPIVADVYVNTGPQAVWPTLDVLLSLSGPSGNYWRWDDPRIVAYLGLPASVAIGSKKAYQKLHVRMLDFLRNFDAAKGVVNSVSVGNLTCWPKRFPYGAGTTNRPSFRRLYVGPANASFALMQPALEVKPEVLTGKTWDQIASAKTRSTFRVIRCVAEQECMGFLDCVNAYDDAVQSAGLYHWTVSTGESLKDPKQTRVPTVDDLVVDPGELPALLALWQAEYPVESGRALYNQFGVAVDPVWEKGKPGRSAVNSWKALRTYVGTVVPLGSSPRALDRFRTSHWFWRFLVICRTEPTFRAAQWLMARLRLRDILSYQIDPSDRPGAPPGKKLVNLSSLFTSELAVALLLRCHVRYANFLSQYGFKTGLPLALACAGINKDPAQWGDVEQAALIEGILAAAGLSAEQAKALKGAKMEDIPDRLKAAQKTKSTDSAKRLADACQAIAAWPQSNRRRFRWAHKEKQKAAQRSVPYWLVEDACGPLSRVHKSFDLDELGLPPLPQT